MSATFAHFFCVYASRMALIEKSMLFSFHSVNV